MPGTQDTPSGTALSYAVKVCQCK